MWRGRCPSKGLVETPFLLCGEGGISPSGDCQKLRFCLTSHPSCYMVRRGRDSNPRGFHLAVFKTAALDHYATSPKVNEESRTTLLRSKVVMRPLLVFPKREKAEHSEGISCDLSE